MPGERALPDLVGRIRLDNTRLKADLAAARAEIDAFSASMGDIGPRARSSLGDADTSVRRFSLSTHDAERHVKSLGDGLTGLLKPSAFFVLGQEAVTLTAALAPAAGALLALPAGAFVAGAAIGTLALGMHSMAPAAQAMAKAERGVADAFAEIGNAVGQPLFDGVAEAMNRLTAVSLPTLRTGMMGVAAGLNDVAKASLGAMTTPVFQGALTSIFSTTHLALSGLSGALGQFIVGLTNLAAAGGPTVLRFTDWVAGGMQTAGAFLASQRGADAMAAAMKRGGDVLSQVWQIGENLGRSLRNVFSAIDTGGFLANMNRGLAEFVKWSATAAGHKELHDAFATLQEIARNMVGILPIVAHTVLELLQAFNSLPGPVKSIVTHFAAWSIVAGPLISHLSGLIEPLGKLAGHLGLVAKLTPVFEKLSLKLSAMAGPIGLAVLGIGALAAAAVYAYDHFKGFHDAVDAVGRALGGAFQGAIAGAKTIWHDFMMGFSTGTGPIDKIGFAISEIGVGFRKAVEAGRAFIDAIEGKKLSPDMLKGFSGALTSIGGALRNVGGIVGAVVGFIADHWKLLGATFLAVTAPMALVVASAVALYARFSVLRNVVNDVAITIGKVLWTALTTIGHVLGDLANMIGSAIKLATDVLTGKWGAAWNDVKRIFHAGLDAVMAILGGIGHIITSILSGLGQIVKDSLGKAWDWAWKETKRAWNSISGAVWDAIQATGRFLVRLPGLVLGWIGDLGKLLVTKGMDLLRGLWSGMKTGFVAVGEFMSNLPETIAFLLGELAGTLLRQGIDLLTGLWNGIKQVWHAEVHFWSDLPGNILAFFKDALHWIEHSGGDILRGLWRGITDAYEAGVQFFKELPDKIRFYFAVAHLWLETDGRRIVHGLWNGIVNAAEAVWDWFRHVPGWIGSFFAAAGGWLLGHGMMVIRGLGDGLSAAWGGVTGWLAALPGRIIGFFGDAGRWLWNAGRELIQGLINGVGSIGNALENKLRDIGRSAIDGFKHAMGIHSPSTVFHGFGVNLMEGLADGITSGASDVHRAVGAVASGLASMRFNLGGANFSPAALSASGGSSSAVTAGYGNSYSVHVNTVPYTPQQVATEAVNALTRLERVHG